MAISSAAHTEGEMSDGDTIAASRAVDGWPLAEPAEQDEPLAGGAHVDTSEVPSIAQGRILARPHAMRCNAMIRYAMLARCRRSSSLPTKRSSL